MYRSGAADGPRTFRKNERYERRRSISRTLVPMTNRYSERVVAFLDCLGFKQKVRDSVADPSLLANLRLTNQVFRSGAAVGNTTDIDFQRLQFSDTLVLSASATPE